MLPIQTFISNKSNYSSGRSSSIKYIVIHYTANNGDTALGNAKYFSGANRYASAHYFVDETSIVQTVKDVDTAWSVGATSYIHKDCRNHNSINIEMCSRIDSNGNYYIKDEVIKNTIDLVKYLMNKYNISSDCVLRHYDVTGKLCPQPFVKNNNLWVNFKNKLVENNEVVEMEVRYNNINEVPSWAKNSVQKLIDKGKFADVNNLNLSYDMIRLIVVITN